MTMLGYPCGHEWAFNLEHVGRFVGLRGDASWLAMPHVLALHPSVRVVHLRRDPLEVVKSVYCSNFLRHHCTCGHEPGAHRNEPYVQYILRFYPDLWDNKTDIERAISWVIWWNRRFDLDVNPKQAFRLEDVSQDPVALEDMVDYLVGEIPPRRAIEAVQAAIPRNTNSHRRAPWDVEIPENSWGEELALLREEYGYCI